MEAENQTSDESDDSEVQDYDYYEDGDISRVTKKVLAIFVVSVGSIAFISNLLMITVMIKEKSLRKNSALHYILWISAIDLIISLWFPFLSLKVFKLVKIFSVEHLKSFF